MSGWSKINFTNWNWESLSIVGGLALVVGIIAGLIILVTHVSDDNNSKFRQACARHPHSYALVTDGTRDCFIPIHGGIERVEINY